MDGMDTELRDWLRRLAEPSPAPGAFDTSSKLSVEGSDYLERIALDGTLQATLDELGAAEPELAG